MNSFAGPMQQIAFPVGWVRGLALDPAAPHVLWATSASGPLVTGDGGPGRGRRPGSPRPADASAIAYLDCDLFVSDGTGVFRNTCRGRRSSAAPASTDTIDADAVMKATGIQYRAGGSAMCQLDHEPQQFSDCSAEQAHCRCGYTRGCLDRAHGRLRTAAPPRSRCPGLALPCGASSFALAATRAPPPVSILYVIIDPLGPWISGRCRNW